MGAVNNLGAAAQKICDKVPIFKQARLDGRLTLIVAPPFYDELRADPDILAGGMSFPADGTERLMILGLRYVVDPHQKEPFKFAMEAAPYE